MADITVTGRVQATKGGATVDSGSKSVTFTMSGTDMVSATQNFTTSATAIDMAAVTGAPKAFMIVNNGPDALSIGLDSAVSTQVFAVLGSLGFVILAAAQTGTMYGKSAGTSSAQVVSVEG